MRDSEYRADTPQYSSVGRRGTQTATRRTLSVSNCHATRRKHEGWDTARLPKPIQRNKAASSDGLNLALSKEGGESVVTNLTILLQNIWDEESMPTEWSASTVILILKNDIGISWENHRDIDPVAMAFEVLSGIILVLFIIGSLIRKNQRCVGLVGTSDEQWRGPPGGFRASPMDVEWAKLLGENVAEKVKTIGQIWAAMGIEGTRLQARKETLSTHLYSMLDAMFDEEIVAQQTIVNSIKELKVKISELESELGFSHSTLVEPLNLIQTEKALFDRFKLLEEKASSITETFNSLRNEEEALAARLDEPTAVILFRHVPNQGQLRTLKDNLDFLTQEKRSRLLRLSELRQEILNIHEAVDIGDLATRSLFTRLKSEDALETLPLSKAFLSEVETFQCACEQLLSAVRSECDQLCVEIEKLALRLNLDHADFLDLDQPTSSSFLTQLREERDRLTELRRKNLSVFIHNCQTELQELWDACRLSEHDRVAAMSWDSEDCSESVLERLEAEIVYWKNFHADHKDVFESLDAWQTSFSQFRDTELKKKDPVILKNRGGILLQVEKQYKQLQREVKRLETLLQKLAADPLHSNLMIHGMKILEFMEASRRQQLEDKENDVNQRRPAQLKRKGDGSPAISSTNRSVRGRYPGNKAACNETPISSRVKKPRLDSSRTLVTRTPLRQFGLPQGEPLRSAQKPGGMTSTPRHSREFLL
ncbi:carboxypeptidase C prc1 [Clonorchis sinensis]|uniref:Carboxypeptidase C prc1 n=1 Tax=Clonorchis sinensis TaxID=79923 RepID=A0A3R7C1K4_CLOSI|nr:carboxypeptidase C prc1 [Clonorchis sinensis]